MNELSKLDINNQTVSTHRDYRDISFYEDNSKIKRCLFGVMYKLKKICNKQVTVVGKHLLQLNLTKLKTILVCTILLLIQFYQLDQLVQHTN